MFFLFLLLISANAQSWVVTRLYDAADVSCAGRVYAMMAINRTVANCTASVQTCGLNVVTELGVSRGITTCETTLPQPLTQITLSGFSEDNCGGDIVTQFSLPPIHTCTPIDVTKTIASFVKIYGLNYGNLLVASSSELVCDGNDWMLQLFTGGQCTFTNLGATEITIPRACVPASDPSIPSMVSVFRNSGCYEGDALCFHESSLIKYDGQLLSMKELENHNECHIPHVIKARGLIIETKCVKQEKKVLKVTGKHLIYTDKG